MERKEVTLYAMTVDDSRSVPIKAFLNADGSYSLAIAGGGTNGAIVAGPQPSSFNDRSATLSEASVAQSLMPANTDRVSLYIQNISVADLWIRFGGGAATEGVGSGKIVADGVFEQEGSTINRDSISIIGGAVGQAFTVWEGVAV